MEGMQMTQRIKEELQDIARELEHARFTDLVNEGAFE